MAKRFIIAGGGTGGHIFPAVAIANALKQNDAAHQILFVGAKGKMEMEKVPQAGYEIKGLDIAGFNRSSLIKNIALPFKLFKSFFQVRAIINEFKPNAVIGVGGYSSFPVLRYAQAKGIPTFIHESNSFAGKSNILLGKKVTKAFVAIDGMEKFFPKERVVISGNPVRPSIVKTDKITKEEALRHFGLKEGKVTVLAVGGSLGARSINEALSGRIDDFEEAGLQLIWQTGKTDMAKWKQKVEGKANIWVNDFIIQMEMAYAAADIVISRSGAMAVAELCVAKKPVVFVPYPHAAEDHQSVNAQKLVDKNAALMVKDSEAKDKMVDTVLSLANDSNQQELLKGNIEKLAVRDADQRIVTEILKVFSNCMMSNDQNIAMGNALSSLKDIKSVYFIGIGGIGMSALARYFIAKGVVVSGYDKTETALTKALIQEGIAIHYTEDVQVIPKEVDLVIYTPAVPRQHAELVYYQERQYKVVKRSDVLGAISSDSFNICVGGTHGKTTVSTMVAHILRHSAYGCNAFLGGISANYNTNFWSDSNNVSVIEADEYDRSFLKLHPDIAIITAMDADHLDICGDEATLQQAFIDFGGKVKPGGLLISKFGLKRIREVEADNKWNYSTNNDAASVYATDLQIEEGGYNFNVQLPTGSISGFRLNMGGMHNVENAVAAIAVAYRLEIEPEKIKAAIADFKGVRRRFEYVLPSQRQEKGGYVYPVFIDDYAHHPEELTALLKSVRSLFPQRKITVIFQPHLFSRTKDFANEFSASLDIADHIILLPIYPARELPMEGVTSEIILKNIQHTKQLLSKEELLDWAAQYAKEMDKEFGEVIVTAGAGDIDQLVQPLKQLFEKA